MSQGGWCRSASPDISEIKVSGMKAQTHFPTHTHTHTPSTQLQTWLSQDQNDIFTSQKQRNMWL